MGCGWEKEKTSLNRSRSFSVQVLTKGVSVVLVQTGTEDQLHPLQSVDSTPLLKPVPREADFYFGIPAIVSCELNMHGLL